MNNSSNNSRDPNVQFQQQQPEQQLNEEKRKNLKLLYEQLDIDKDGKVDIKELSIALRKRMPNITETSDYAQVQ